MSWLFICGAEAYLGVHHRRQEIYPAKSIFQNFAITCQTSYMGICFSSCPGRRTLCLGMHRLSIQAVDNGGEIGSITWAKVTAEEQESANFSWIHGLL